ncbi:MAG: hypothetical protein IPL23_29085 [Saprospiraceae bacterium]|nr:hypothetical protein [Saprospiraceae bacterium]MBK8635493.1 hypothetical protein [Saprospiraceae bacterium]MBP7642658.1 hypothetical protein [Saprospiraceae bacterium]HMS69658.1 hypothetical protein [Saprospiraceae bacterium]
MTRPMYRVEHINRELYVHKVWGTVDYVEKSKQIAALLNEYDEMGYRLLEIIASPDPLGGTNEIYIFILKNP